jgi:predicted transcriptional regulator YdeE
MLHHREAFKLVGIETRTSNSLEMDPETARIPGLWGRFFHEGVRAQLPCGDSSGGITAVYTAYEGDHTAPYSLVLGCALKDPGASIPPGMTIVDVPEQDYLVFSGRGAMPDAVIQTWRKIWGYFQGETSFERAYISDFEEYRAGGSEVEIFIGVRQKSGSNTTT